MKKFKKVLLYAVILVVLIIVSVLSYVTLALPNVGPAENIKVELTPQRIARGKYLAINVSSCLDCHSVRDDSRFGGPVNYDKLGVGGSKFDDGVGFPGNVTVPNITPFKLKDWTDGEIFRAITTGVKKDGSAIFPLMPWPYYSKMDREDLYSIIAYLRTLKPQETAYPTSTLNFPLNVLVHTMPQKATLGTKPNPTDTLNYGAYLVQSAACKQCHSQDVKGELIAGMEFAGGKEFKVNGNIIRSANITSDKMTGIGNWTKEEFIARFALYSDESKASHVGPKDFQTIMPWWNYNGLSHDDLNAIYTYLHSLKPVKNTVVKFTLNNAMASAGLQ
jgi:mono/diheme cytochrome c family protein